MKIDIDVKTRKASGTSTLVFSNVTTDQPFPDQLIVKVSMGAWTAVDVNIEDDLNICFLLDKDAIAWDHKTIQSKSADEVLAETLAVVGPLMTNHTWAEVMRDLIYLRDCTFREGGENRVALIRRTLGL